MRCSSRSSRRRCSRSRPRWASSSPNEIGADPESVTTDVVTDATRFRRRRSTNTRPTLRHRAESLQTGSRSISTGSRSERLSGASSKPQRARRPRRQAAPTPAAKAPHRRPRRPAPGASRVRSASRSAVTPMAPTPCVRTRADSPTSTSFTTSRCEISAVLGQTELSLREVVALQPGQRLRARQALDRADRSLRQQHLDRSRRSRRGRRQVRGEDQRTQSRRRTRCNALGHVAMDLVFILTFAFRRWPSWALLLVALVDVARSLAARAASSSRLDKRLVSTIESTDARAERRRCTS